MPKDPKELLKSTGQHMVAGGKKATQQVAKSSRSFAYSFFGGIVLALAVIVGPLAFLEQLGGWAFLISIIGLGFVLAMFKN